MPTPEQILSGLGSIANQWKWLAIFWHVYLGAIALTFITGKRLSARFMGLLLALPLFSVSGLAWSIGNLFNGWVFAFAGLLAGIVSLKLSRQPVVLAPAWAVIAGVLLLGFGWVYPHFLREASWWMYLYAAPAGLVPCPTLSAIIGFGLIAGGLNSRTWTLAVGITGLFYGVFGALRLGVMIDWVLFAGAFILVLYPFLVRSVSYSGSTGSVA